MVVPYLVIDQASIPMGLVSTGSLDQQDQVLVMDGIGLFEMRPHNGII